MRDLTRNRSGFIKDQRGTVVSFLLLIAPLLILSIVFIIESSSTVEATDRDLQDAVSTAARAAAHAVNPSSQAQGDPHIDADKACMVFADILKDNLGLDASFEPLDGSGLASPPDFILIVYNGQSLYGLPAQKTFSYWDGAYQEFESPGMGFPYPFAVSNTDLQPGTTGEDRTVVLDSPGVVALLRCNTRPMVMAEGKTATRWASAKVVFGGS